MYLRAVADDGDMAASICWILLRVIQYTNTNTSRWLAVIPAALSEKDGLADTASRTGGTLAR